jgi:oxygen-independent coproporphyrinogen III oxidase
MDTYVQALSKEIKLSKADTVSSIFIGGGTPSLLNIQHLSAILKDLDRKFTILSDAEITMEANPGTLPRGYLKEIKSIGINRLSIGVQSFIDRELDFLQRIHNAETAERSIMNAIESGFENLSMDLIFSIPGQNISNWAYSLDKAINLGINHISCYSLTYEEGTPIHRMYESGKIIKQDEEIDAEMFEHTMEYLSQNGFIHYEISNYAKQGMLCKHNLNYWNGGSYSGFGSAAHSYDGEKRFWNVRSVDKYIDMINSKGNATEGSEYLTEESKIEEKIYLGIRCGKLNISDIIPKPSSKLLSELQMMEKAEYIKIAGENIELTNKGFLMADEISLRLISCTLDQI